MALAEAVRKPRLGNPLPRLAPPTPAVSDLPAFRETAAGMGIVLMPWQCTSARYLTARGADGLHQFREVCIVVARQNGKTTLMKPLIIRALRDGKRVIHVAQVRELPRHMFGVIADALSEEPDLFPKRRGKVIWPRYGAGQEEILLVNGGSYRIAAAGRGGGRGWPADLVIVDELREMQDFEVVSALEPTLTMSADPQMVFLSNAGDDKSVVLNSVRSRAETNDAGDSLAYLEWSARPDRAADDLDGWREANPAFGHYPQVRRTLESSYAKHKLGGTLAIFETEHLCRWVNSTRQRLVDDFAWAVCAAEELEAPKRPWIGISTAPEGTRVSVAATWRQSDDTIALRLLHNVSGNPVNIDAFGADLRKEARAMGVSGVLYDPLTDAALAKFFSKPEPVAGQKFANASSIFVHAVTAGKLRWQDADAISDDLTWTAAKHDRESGTFQAVRSSDERPITASLAAIRAVWRASDPKPPALRLY